MSLIPSVNFLLLTSYFMRASRSLLFAAVLCLTHLLHPVDDLPVERFLNGDMRHRGRWHCAVPMFFVRRKPDHVAWPDFLDRTAFALCPSQTGGDDQRLTEWMCMPGGAGARLERDARATNARWIRRLEQWLNPHFAREPLCRSCLSRQVI